MFKDKQPTKEAKEILKLTKQEINNPAFPKLGLRQGDMNNSPYYTFFFKPGDRDNQ